MRRFLNNSPRGPLSEDGGDSKNRIAFACDEFPSCESIAIRFAEIAANRLAYLSLQMSKY